MCRRWRARHRRLAAGFAVLSWLAFILALSCERPAPKPPPPPRRVGAAYPRLVSPAEAAQRAWQSYDAQLEDVNIPWAANATMRALFYVSETLQRSEYTHARDVDFQQGDYRFDCSGMVDWVLSQSSPVAAGSVRRGRVHRPLAKDFYHVIASSPVARAHRGWSRVVEVSSVRPGDVVAWVKREQDPSRHTGHVAFFVHPPARIRGYADAYLARIADSTTLAHALDNRPERMRGGFGLGTIVIVVDEADAPVGFGWAATLSPEIYLTDMAMGRPVKRR